MQVLYGSDGENYTVLAKTSDMNDQIISELKNSHFFTFDFTKKKYSKGKDPRALSFVTTSLNGKLGSDHILVSQSKQMMTFKTPCYMSHVQIIDKDKGVNSYKNAEIRALLNIEFISSSEAAAYNKGELKLEDFDCKKKTNEVDKEINCGIPDIAREAAISLLAACEDSLKKVTVIVDADDDYNKRVKEIILDIYTHMPYGWRSRLGFCSFITEDMQPPEGTILQFMEKGSKVEQSQYCIDLNRNEDEYFEKQMENIQAECKEYVHAFLDKTAEERKKKFDDLAVLFNTDYKIKEYWEWKKSVVAWNVSINKIKSGKEEDIKGQMKLLAASWVNFFSQHCSEEHYTLREHFKKEVQNHINTDSRILSSMKDGNMDYLKKFCELAMEEDQKINEYYNLVLKKNFDFFYFMGYSYSVENVENFFGKVLNRQNEEENVDVFLQRIDNLNKYIQKLFELMASFSNNYFSQKWNEMYTGKYKEAEERKKLLKQKKIKDKQYIQRIFSDQGDFINNFEKYFTEFIGFDQDNQEFFRKQAGQWIQGSEFERLEWTIERKKNWCNKYSNYIDKDYVQDYLKRCDDGCLKKTRPGINVESLGINELDTNVVFDKYRMYQDWSNISRVALFAENAKNIYITEISKINKEKCNLEKEVYSLACGKEMIDVFMDLEEAKELAVFLLEPDRGKILDLKKDIISEIIKSSLLTDHHWKNLLNGHYSGDIEDIIWKAYFLADVILTDDNFTNYRLNRHIRQEKESRKGKNEERFDLNIANEDKKMQYERLISNKSLVDLKTEWDVYEQCLDIIAGLMPAGLAALFQVFLIKAFSGNVGLITAIIMTFLGIGFMLFMAFVSNRNDSFNEHKLKCGLLGGVLFIGLGWIVMILNIFF